MPFSYLHFPIPNFFHEQFLFPMRTHFPRMKLHVKGTENQYSLLRIVLERTLIPHSNAKSFKRIGKGKLLHTSRGWHGVESSMNTHEQTIHEVKMWIKHIVSYEYDALFPFHFNYNPYAYRELHCNHIHNEKKNMERLDGTKEGTFAHRFPRISWSSSTSNTLAKTAFR